MGGLTIEKIRYLTELYHIWAWHDWLIFSYTNYMEFIFGSYEHKSRWEGLLL
jgi:hypothetical protein